MTLDIGHMFDPTFDFKIHNYFSLKKKNNQKIAVFFISIVLNREKKLYYRLPRKIFEVYNYGRLYSKFCEANSISFLMQTPIFGLLIGNATAMVW